MDRSQNRTVNTLHQPLPLQTEQTDDLPIDRGNHPADLLAEIDDACWEVFVPDDDQLDPDPEPGDLWFDAA